MSNLSKYQPKLTVIDGTVKVTSIQIADHFKKNHRDVLRAIRELECSPEFNRRNFAPVEYLDTKGEKRPMYYITKDGFMFLVMGFTGKEAAQWKEAYINAFNQMEQRLTVSRVALEQIALQLAFWNLGEGKSC